MIKWTTFRLNIFCESWWMKSNTIFNRILNWLDLYVVSRIEIEMPCISTQIVSWEISTSTRNEKKEKKKTIRTRRKCSIVQTNVYYVNCFGGHWHSVFVCGWRVRHSQESITTFGSDWAAFKKKNNKMIVSFFLDFHL